MIVVISELLNENNENNNINDNEKYEENNEIESLNNDNKNKNQSLTIDNDKKTNMKKDKNKQKTETPKKLTSKAAVYIDFESENVPNEPSNDDWKQLSKSCIVMSCFFFYF